MSFPITTHVPSFNGDKTFVNSGRVHDSIEVVSPHVLMSKGSAFAVSAIASQGFSASKAGTHVFVAHIEQMVLVDAGLLLGVTSTNSVKTDSTRAFPGCSGMDGACWYLYLGQLYGGTGKDSLFHKAGRFTGDSRMWQKNYLPSHVTQKAKVIVCTFTISSNLGNTKRSIQFTVDGNEGPAVELEAQDFDGDEIFPVVALPRKPQKVEFIPFDQVNSRGEMISQVVNTKEFAARKEKLTNFYEEHAPYNLPGIHKSLMSVLTNDEAVEAHLEDLKKMYECH